MKEWKTPRLIALVRNKPEEAVLSACKTSTGGGPNDNDNSCQDDPGGYSSCGNCDDIVTS